MNNIYDILVIGGGAVGCAVARELSRYQLKICVLEKNCDVGAGASGRNSAVVHAGFNNKPGTLMAKFCVEGNQSFEKLCKELDVPCRKTGKLLVAFDKTDLSVLEGLIRQGEANGCEGLHLISKDDLRQMAPNVDGIGAMVSPNTAIFDPFLYTVALAENALANGVEFFLNREVSELTLNPQGWTVKTKCGSAYHTKLLINCAGLYSDKVAAMAGITDYQIYPCRGEYLILDKAAMDYLDIPVYPAPRKGIGGLGVHLTPTIHGNLLIGPNAEYIEEFDDYATEKETMDELLAQAKLLLPPLERKHVIGSYSGIRSKQTSPQVGGFADFIIREEVYCPGLIDLIGIESPGMTASVPIARYVTEMVCNKLHPEENATFNPIHHGILRFAQQSSEVQAKLIEEDSDYGEIVCRCQQITKKEIRQAIENPLGVQTIAAIKYRVWPTTGRCQGGYCLTRIVEMLEHEYGVRVEEISQRGEGTELFPGRVKP